MTVNISDYKQLLDLAVSMAEDGYKFAVYPQDEITDVHTLSFFKTSWEAAENCYEMSNDADFYKSLPVASLINDLNTVELTGVDTTENEAFDLLDLPDGIGTSPNFQILTFNKIL